MGGSLRSDSLLIRISGDSVGPSIHNFLLMTKQHFSKSFCYSVETFIDLILLIRGTDRKPALH